MYRLQSWIFHVRGLQLVMIREAAVRIGCESLRTRCDFDGSADFLATSSQLPTEQWSSLLQAEAHYTHEQLVIALRQECSWAARH